MIQIPPKPAASHDLLTGLAPASTQEPRFGPASASAKGNRNFNDALASFNNTVTERGKTSTRLEIEARDPVPETSSTDSEQSSSPTAKPPSQETEIVVSKDDDSDSLDLTNTSAATEQEPDDEKPAHEIALMLAPSPGVVIVEPESTKLATTGTSSISEEPPSARSDSSTLIDVLPGLAKSRGPSVAARSLIEGDGEMVSDSRQDPKSQIENSVSKLQSPVAPKQAAGTQDQISPKTDAMNGAPRPSPAELNTIPSQPKIQVQEGSHGPVQTTKELIGETMQTSAAKQPGILESARQEGQTRERSRRDGQARGTDGAKSAQQMQNTAQKGHDLPLNLQPLPGRDLSLPPQGTPAALTASENPSRPSPLLPASRQPHNAALMESILIGQSPAQSLDAAPVASSRSAPASQVTVLEDLQLRVVNGAMQLRAARKDSMEVVIRPDTRTEMVLHLSRQNGLVDVEARMQRGDAGNLASQWSQLQQSLAQQGIRLTALQPFEGVPNQFPEHFGQSAFHKEQPSPHEQEESTLTPPLPETIPGKRASASSATSQSAKGSFESWA